MPLAEQHVTVSADTEGRIDQIVRTLTGRSWSDVRGLFAHQCVALNGAECSDAGAIVASGDSVAVRHDKYRRYRAPPAERSNSAFDLVYEDADMLVVDKAAHLLTVPTDRRETNTLIDVVTRYLQRKNSRARPGVVHRLDRGTSGLLVFGKTERIAKELQAQFREQKAEREYVAIVSGRVSDDKGTFDGQLGTTASLQRYVVGEDEEGEDAVTRYQVVERLRDATLVRVQLETGRRNQIRVHFADAGHPVLGDQRYGTASAAERHWKARRLALHACTLGFRHPRTGEEVRFESPLPDEMKRFRDRARRRRS